jgi:predicted ferric reductase
MRGILMLGGYTLVILLPVLAFFWLPGTPEHGVLFDMGRGAAMAAFAILMLQPVLAGRFKAAERPFGFDIVIRFHQAVAVFALLLLIVHPFLLAAGGGGWDLLFSLNVPPEIWVGKAALVLLVATVGLSVFRERLSLDFQKWRVIHTVLALLILMGAFLHSWAAGADLEDPFYRGLWIVLLVLAVMAFSYHRILRPLRLARRPWKVTRVEQIVPRVWSIHMSPPEGRPVHDHAPGQFHFLTFRGEGDLPVEEHHFTISSSPTEEGGVTSTIKESGDFTARIGEVRAGDSVTVLGPYGRFSAASHPLDRKILFLAGGIGITPIRSMLRYMADRREDRDVVLLFGNPTESDIVFREELVLRNTYSFG